MTNYSPTNKTDGSNGLALDSKGNLIPVSTWRQKSCSPEIFEF